MRYVAGLILALSLLPRLAHAQTETVEYYGTDLIGSIRIVWDANGNVVGRQDYGPFGRPLFATAGLPKQGFGGQETDAETDQAYFHARMLQARTARFTRPDRLVGALANPQSLNRYAFAWNNATTYIDPTGLFPMPVILCNVLCRPPDVTVTGQYPVGGWGRSSQGDFDIAVDLFDPLFAGGQTGGAGVSDGWTSSETATAGASSPTPAPGSPASPGAQTTAGASKASTQSPVFAVKIDPAAGDEQFRQMILRAGHIAKPMTQPSTYAGIIAASAAGGVAVPAVNAVYGLGYNTAVLAAIGVERVFPGMIDFVNAALPTSVTGPTSVTSWGTAAGAIYSVTNCIVSPNCPVPGGR